MQRYIATYYVWDRTLGKMIKAGSTELSWFAELGITLPALAFLHAPEKCKHADKVTFEAA